MDRYLTSHIQPADLPCNIESYLKQHFHLTRREISAAKFQADGICLNGQKARVNTALRAGDELRVSLTGRDRSAPDPSMNFSYSADDMSTHYLNILYEDDDLIAVNKPAGICTHPGRGHYGDTLSDLITHHCQGAPARAVGRLDKDTSGIVVFAKHAPAAARLSAQDRCTHAKIYLFLSHDTGWSEEWRHVFLPVRKGPSQLNRMELCPDTAPGALSAYTCIRKICSFPNEEIMLGAAVPVTGRTHQIRVHMAGLGYPLLGDPIYNMSSLHNSFCSDAIRPLALHCAFAGFVQPFTNEKLFFISPAPDWLVNIFSKRLNYESLLHDVYASYLSNTQF